MTVLLLWGWRACIGPRTPAIRLSRAPPHRYGSPAATALGTATPKARKCDSVPVGPRWRWLATSNGATGSTAATPDSLSPLGGGVALFNMLLGEVTYGGLGTGLISMVLTALLAVFVGALMIGRRPRISVTSSALPR